MWFIILSVKLSVFRVIIIIPISIIPIIFNICKITEIFKKLLSILRSWIISWIVICIIIIESATLYHFKISRTKYFVIDSPGFVLSLKRIGIVVIVSRIWIWLNSLFGIRISSIEGKKMVLKIKANPKKPILKKPLLKRPLIIKCPIHFKSTLI